VPELTWRGFFWRSLIIEVFFGQVWENPGKIPSHPKNLPAPTPMIRRTHFIIQEGVSMTKCNESLRRPNFTESCASHFPMALNVSRSFLYTSASQPFWCRGPHFAETLILGPLHEKFVSELMTRRNYCVILEHFAAQLKELRAPPVEKRCFTTYVRQERHSINL